MNEIYTTVLSYKTKAEDEGKTVEQILKKEFRFSAGLIKELKMVEKLKINGVPSRSVDTVRNGDIVSADIGEIQRSEIPEFDLEPEILFEDAHILVVNKPPGLSIHPCRGDYEKTLAGAIIHHWRKNGEEHNFHAVNRLDKNTSGIMLAAKTNFAHENLAKQIKEKTAIRKYLAIALVDFKEKEGIIDKPLLHSLKDDVKMIVANEGLEAITHYKVLEEYKGASLVELNLKTGRTHQIRAHLSSIGHPIFGDSLYGAKSFMRNEFYNLKTTQQLLQSYYLSFSHPKTGKQLEFQLEEKDFSKDFIKVLNFLRSNCKYEY